MPECKCQQCRQFHPKGGDVWLWMAEYEVKFCPECGQKLNGNGSVTDMVPMEALKTAVHYHVKGMTDLAKDEGILIDEGLLEIIGVKRALDDSAGGSNGENMYLW